MIQAVTVVPMLAPIITLMDSASVSNPAFTKLTTITVVAEEDWIRAVINTPVRTPLPGWWSLPLEYFAIYHPRPFVSPRS